MSNKSADPIAIGSTEPPLRRIYNIVDPSALAVVYAAGLRAAAAIGAAGDDRRRQAERDVLAFAELVRRPADDL